MDITLDIPIKVNVALDDVDATLMVCSHERSGTHFLMNSLASCTKYVSSPWLNYDFVPFGGAVNFFSEISVRKFFAGISRIEVNGSRLGMASIVKSHFPLSMVQCALDTGMRVAYIYRNPVDTLHSFLGYVHKWDWFEGPKLATALELARHVPCGSSQRYQRQNCECYFDRWALHVTDAVHVANGTDKVVLIPYESLVSSHASSLKALATKLGIALVKDPVYPARDKHVIAVAKRDVSDEARQNLRDFCAERAKRFPDLPADILERI